LHEFFGRELLATCTYARDRVVRRRAAHWHYLLRIWTPMGTSSPQGAGA